MTRFLGVVSLVCRLVIVLGAAHAEDFICSNGTTLIYYKFLVDIEHIPPCEGPAMLVVVPDTPPGTVQQQFLLYDRVPQRHIKVEGGLMVEMTPEEKAIVDAPLLDLQQRIADLRAEGATRPFCGSMSLRDIQNLMKGIRMDLANRAAACANPASCARALDIAFRGLGFIVEDLAICVVKTNLAQ